MSKQVTENRKKVDWTAIDVPIRHEGKHLILPGEPEAMKADSAIKLLQRWKEQENQKFDVSELVEGAPWDCLVAINRALKELYGVVLAETLRTPFGDIRPTFVTVNTGPRPEEKIQVMANQLGLPNWDDPVWVELHPRGCRVYGTVRKIDRARLVEVANLARKIVQEESIYRGKAIELMVDDAGQLQLKVQPSFINLERVSESDAIHTRNTEALIQTNIYGPLKNTEACRKHSIPLKRGILLTGKYGTGKSLTARCTARVATDNGWTMIVLNRAQGLKAALEFAKNYQPCVVFAEDIDRCADRSEESVNDLVNTMDGIITKSMEVMVVLTTNFIDKIDKALLRPGRFDAIIPIEAPDQETAIRLVKAYGRDLLMDDADLSEVGKILDQQIPATIREVVERSKLSMLMADREFLKPEDLYAAAVQMKTHMDLLEDKTVIETPKDKLWAGFSALVGGGVGGAASDTIELLTNAVRHVGGEVRNARAALSREVKEAETKATMAAGAASEAKDAARRAEKAITGANGAL
jgi:SpoVK/Ycf46/Vps4 family AAA+-type ATPase